MDTPPPAAELRVLSTLAVMGVLRALAPDFERSCGLHVDASFAPTLALLDRIAAGESADVAILTETAVEQLTGAGTLARGTRIDLARSFVGIAVRHGAPKPEIGSVDAFRHALLAARSIAYSGAGASGVFFAALIRRLGVADEVNAKATVIPSGLTGALVARGEAELAVQQVSELMEVDGLDIVGRLPAELGGAATFSAAIFADTAHAQPARALLAFLASPANAAAFTARGLEPLGAV